MSAPSTVPDLRYVCWHCIPVLSCSSSESYSILIRLYLYFEGNVYHYILFIFTNKGSILEAISSEEDVVIVIPSTRISLFVHLIPLGWNIFFYVISWRHILMRQLAWILLWCFDCNKDHLNIFLFDQSVVYHYDIFLYLFMFLCLYLYTFRAF